MKTPRFCPHCAEAFPEIVSLDVVNAYQPITINDDGTAEFGVSKPDWESALGQEYQYHCCGMALEEEEQTVLDQMLGTARHPVSLSRITTEDANGH